MLKNVNIVNIFSGPCSNDDYLGHSKDHDWLTDWSKLLLCSKKSRFTHEHTWTVKCGTLRVCFSQSQVSCPTLSQIQLKKKQYSEYSRCNNCTQCQNLCNCAKHKITEIMHRATVYFSKATKWCAPSVMRWNTFSRSHCVHGLLHYFQMN